MSSIKVEINPEGSFATAADLEKKLHRRQPKKMRTRSKALQEQRRRARVYLQTAKPEAEGIKGYQRQMDVLDVSYRDVPESGIERIELMERADAEGMDQTPGSAEDRQYVNKRKKIMRTGLEHEKRQRAIGHAAVKGAEHGVRVRGPEVAERLEKQAPRGVAKLAQREKALERLARMSKRIPRGKKGIIKGLIRAFGGYR